MKVLLVNDYATPTYGAERMTLALRDGLRRRGHDARLFASTAGVVDGASDADFTCTGTTGRWRTVLQTFNPSAARNLKRVVADFKPDVVHVRMFLTQLSPLILAALKNVPALYHVVWYRPICPTGTKTLPNGQACRQPAGIACYRCGCVPLRDWPLLMTQMKMWRSWRDAFDVIVANSHAVRRSLLDAGIEPVEVIHNGIAVSQQRPPLSDPPTVCAAGRFVREKGFDSLLRAFALARRQIPNAHLILAGDGAMRGELVQLVDQLRLNDAVQLTGHLSHPQMEEKFASAWVQAAPSRWAEPFGIVAPEAMMRGTAVIATNAGGLAEIVRHDETGLLVPPNDDDALATAIVRLLRDRDLCERMGAAGRAVALAEFSEDIFLDRVLQLYGRMLTTPHGEASASSNIVHHERRLTAAGEYGGRS